MLDDGFDILEEEARWVATKEIEDQHIKAIILAEEVVLFHFRAARFLFPYRGTGRP